MGCFRSRLPQSIGGDQSSGEVSKGSRPKNKTKNKKKKNKKTKNKKKKNQGGAFRWLGKHEQTEKGKGGTRLGKNQDQNSLSHRVSGVEKHLRE